MDHDQVFGRARGHKASPTLLIVATAVFVVLFCNFTFFRHVLEVYPLADGNLLFVVSLAALEMAAIVSLLGIVCFRRSTKPVLILLLLSTALAAYFIDAYDIVLDTGMIRNTLNTDAAEVRDLLNLKILTYFVFLGLLPAMLVMRSRILPETGPRQLFRAVSTTGIGMVMCVAIVMSQSSQYAGFVREHKPLRFYSNPLFHIYSGIQYAAVSTVYAAGRNSDPALRLVIAPDAHAAADDANRKLVIMVVGEAARADRFSLNGYARETNPLLAAEDVVSFQNMRSCGTATMVSVPCMFSDLGRAEFSNEKAASRQNLLDVLQHAGVNVLWRDNNSSSKGVAVDVPYESFKSSDNNSECDDECRDVGMLSQLQDYIDRQADGDIFIVLHQMGNHGPAYFKRYPEGFAKFLPACDTSRLEDCSAEEISNAYDNVILYTDYFLASVIGFLKQNDANSETAMFYVSDHGESLGEGGVFLHGLPYFMAPDSQTHVASILWFGQKFGQKFGKKFGAEFTRVSQRRGQPYSHDNVFHTVLGLMGIRTKIYEPRLDMARRAATNASTLAP